nr:hypothetical protein [Synechocystis salina]
MLGTDENDPKALVRIPAEGLGGGGSTEYTILDETALDVDGFINIIPGSYLYVGNQKAKIDCSLLENSQRVEFINLSLFDCFFLGFNNFINYTNEGILLEGEGLVLKKGGVIFSVYENTCLFFANYAALNKLFYDGDPFANQVILLLHFEGAEGSTNYLDESPLNLTVSNFGAAKITQARQKYGSSSFLSNSSSNYLSANSVNIPCTNTFTIEAWVFLLRGQTTEVFSALNPRQPTKLYLPPIQINWLYGLLAERSGVRIKPYLLTNGCILQSPLITANVRFSETGYR